MEDAKEKWEYVFKGGLLWMSESRGWWKSTWTIRSTLRT
jgi:hypothetical protein